MSQKNWGARLLPDAPSLLLKCNLSKTTRLRQILAQRLGLRAGGRGGVLVLVRA